MMEPADGLQVQNAQQLKQNSNVNVNVASFAAKYQSKRGKCFGKSCACQTHKN